MGTEVLALWVVMGCKEKYKPPEGYLTDPLTAESPFAPTPGTPSEADKGSTTYIRFEGSAVSVEVRVRTGRVDGVEVSFRP